MFSVSTVLGDKASEVKQPLGASAKLPEHWTGRGPVNESVMFGELMGLFFHCFRSVHG